jgi:hypothetical protein
MLFCKWFKKGLFMKLAILYKQSDSSNGISLSLKKLGGAFEELGHEVIYIDASEEKTAAYLLKQNSIETIWEYRFYCYELLKKLYKLAFFLKIPILNQDYVQHNLSSLLDLRSKNCMSNENQHEKSIMPYLV